MGSLGNTTPDQPQAQRGRRSQPDRHHRPAGPADSVHQGDRLVYLGTDSDGTLLEVAVETDEGLVIIHAMPIRERYRKYLEDPRR